MFKPPPDPKTFQVLKHRSPTDLKGSKKPKAVLDEDDYVEKVGQIIERDFFPELEKLRRALKGGPGTRAEDKASGSASTAQVDQSPATFETPDLGLNKGPRYSRDRTPAVPDHPQESSLLQASPGRVEEANKVDDADETRKVSSSSSTSMRLDEFMAKHTGEDNESFNELAEESRQEFIRSHGWMFKEDEQLSIENKRMELSMPGNDNDDVDGGQGMRRAIQYRSEKDRGRCKPVQGWTYRNVNTVFYPPEGAELSPDEKVTLAKKQKEIVLENTRFSGNPWKSGLQSATVFRAAMAKRESALGKVGADGKSVVVAAASGPEGSTTTSSEGIAGRIPTPSVNGYKFMKIHDASPQIDPEASPFMTWGEIEGTPYRLEGGDSTPLLLGAGGAGRTPGPSFTMQEVSRRDRLALQLAEKNSRLHRDKKNRAIEKARSNLRGTTPSSTTGSASRLVSMSPAAQRLATSKLGIRLGTDKALLAHYTPSPRTRVAPTTPNLIGSVRKNPAGGTPSRSVRNTPAGPQPAASPVNMANITDNLLNLPSSLSSSTTTTSSLSMTNVADPKRSKASDFF